MAKELVIVESPAKAKTLSRILGSRYAIKACIGHVRDLPKSKLGVDVDKDFNPTYVVPKEKRNVVKGLQEAAQKSKNVYLATDPDREGEAISWHLIAATEIDGAPIHRVTFHEITEEAIKEAFRHPRALDMDLVDAQQARRILDRLVGYKISPLLWRKIRGRLSAGRVQSAALRIIVEREQEIQDFVSREYWTIDAELSKQEGNHSSFRAKFIGIAGEKEPLDITTQDESARIVEVLRDAVYTIAKVSKKNVLRQPPPPFITSTLQQEAWRKLRFTSKRAMATAQQLYEGLPVGDEGTVGLITYMRTDSTAVAETALKETREFIRQRFGAEFLPRQPRKFAKKVKGAQEAHEAIRPTRPTRDPNSIKQYLTSDQAKLYELIWKRMISSQMAAASFDSTAVDIEAKDTNNYLLRSTGSVLRFSGFLSLYSESKDELDNGDEAKNPLPQLSKGEVLTLVDLFPEQRFTQPPPRYTEATLVKAMEEKGIGRPSTYAPTISTLFQRGYVERIEGKFHPLEVGITVDKAMIQHFPDIVDIDFTAQMEERLDKIAQGKLGWVNVMREFYTPFEQALDKASVDMEVHKEAPELTDQLCPQCGKPMVVRKGRYGKFMACSGFPKCKTTQPLPSDEGQEPHDAATTKQAKAKSVAEPTDQSCPNCGKPMVIRKGRYGKFMACSGFPKCKTTMRMTADSDQESPDGATTKQAKTRSVAEPTDQTCPNCGKPMVIRKGRYGRFLACTGYPKCKTTKRIAAGSAEEKPSARARGGRKRGKKK
jgi:DNA topoisomerase-1